MTSSFQVMRLAIRDQFLLLLHDDGSERVMKEVYLPPLWRRTAGGYEGEVERWREVFVHRGAGAIWVRVVDMSDAESGGIQPTFETAFRSDDGGRTWSSQQKPADDVRALPVIAQLTTHPTVPADASRRV